MRRVRQASIALAVLASCVYLAYRGWFTLNPDARVFSAAVYLAELHGFLALVFYGFHAWAPRARLVPPPPMDVSVDVFITSADEDIVLVRQAVRGAMLMRHPHRTCVLDARQRDAVRALCAELGCEYLAGDANGRKEEMWNRAFALTSGDVVVTFGADQVPRADFLERTLGFFADPNVGLVQVPQRCHNGDSFQHRVDWRHRRLHGQQDMFFNVVMPGKDHWNAVFSCGTGVVFRRAALAPHGGLPAGAEDPGASLRLHARGWASVYVNELLVTGLAPVDVSGYSSQWLRRAAAHLRVLRTANPLTCRGLTLAQRVAYTASLHRWTRGLARLVFVVTPPLILFTGVLPVAGVDGTMAALLLLHLATFALAYRLTARSASGLWMDEVFTTAHGCALAYALGRWMSDRLRGLTATRREQGSSDGDDRAVLPQRVLIGLTVMALVWGALELVFGVTDDLLVVGLVAVWALYNLTLMMVVVGVANRPRQRRRAVRFRAVLPIELLNVPANGRLAVSFDLSESGCALLWPGRLPAGSRLQMRLHVGSQALNLEGEVVSLHARVGRDWVGYGIRFRHASPADVDRLADAIYNTAIPEMFARLSRPSRVAELARLAWRRLLGVVRVRPTRREAFLPLRIQTDGGEFLATTRDLGPGGLGVVSPRPLKPGSIVRLVLRSLEGEWSGQATVVRVAAMPGGVENSRTWMVGLRIDGTPEVDGLYHIMAAEAWS